MYPEWRQVEYLLNVWSILNEEALLEDKETLEFPIKSRRCIRLRGLVLSAFDDYVIHRHYIDLFTFNISRVNNRAMVWKKVGVLSKF